MIDVAGGDKVPRKGGPGVTQSDLLVINKTDLAEAVGADLKARSRPHDSWTRPHGHCSGTRWEGLYLNVAQSRVDVRRSSLLQIVRGRNVHRNRSRGQTERGGILRVGSCTHCMAGD